jgi:SAM-dependent methyltransferase
MRKLFHKYRSLFLLRGFRIRVVRLRVFFFVKIKKQLKLYNSDKAFEVTIPHNLKSLTQCNDRMETLIRPLSCIEKVNSNSKVLVIGPRNENDLFSLFGNGFSWGNIIGLDLISYSPKIKLGDMHDIPFQDGFFDVVLCGWTLSYSSTPDIAAKEILRVTKKGGIIGIGVEYSTLTKEDSEQLSGYSIQDFSKLSKRVNSTAEILSLFHGNVEHVFFDHDAPNKISHSRSGLVDKVSHVVAIFSKT